MRTKKRTLVTTKVFGFNPWMDQLLAINQMMEATGQKSEAPILRDLVDEGLIARRRKAAGSEVSEQPVPVVSVQELAQTLETNQTLLLRIIEQGHSAFRMHRASLELSQEAIVEARTGKIWSWETLVTSLREGGSSAQQIADLLEEKTEESKGYAYGLAEEIRDQLDAEERDSANATVDDDDRQGRLVYDHSDPVEDTHEDVV